RLHWAELTFSNPGQRVFNVAINGNTVLSNFDVFATGGYKKALVKEFTATADSNGQINISFTQAGADNPFISGIEIYTA
ncbi:MAG TPA: malectin domain-containing carbohydrate-binding protein, partial [Ktedonobacteraceae bacterium]|nr:malectin domain-containing carbohydrate-binding protein [Ktedonobacteraceae bacterium]